MGDALTKCPECGAPARHFDALHADRSPGFVFAAASLDGMRRKKRTEIASALYQYSLIVRRGSLPDQASKMQADRLQELSKQLRAAPTRDADGERPMAKWQQWRNASRLLDASGKIIGRVEERSYPHWGEWSGEANNTHIGVYASEHQAKAAVERAAPSSDAPQQGGR